MLPHVMLILVLLSLYILRLELIYSLPVSGMHEPFWVVTFQLIF